MTELLAPGLLLGYGLLLLSIGGYYGRRRGGAEWFFLADRTLGTFGVFGTTFSTFLGTGLVFTLSALGYRFGVGAFLLPFAAVVGFLLLAWAAPQLKAQSDRLGAVTLPALLAEQWGVRTRLLASLVTAALFTGTLAANLLVVGDVVGAFLDVEPAVAIGAFATLVVGYTVVGGFRAVVWTDVVQMALIVIAIGIVLPMLALPSVSGPIAASVPPSHLDPRSLPLPVLVAYLSIGVFAFFGSQDLFQRIFAARGPSEARRGLLAFTVPLVGIGTAAIGLGIVARGLFPAIAADRALLTLATAVTPAGLVGIVLVGVLALANSDADSQMLTVASNVTRDALPSVGMAPDQPVMIDRLAVAGIGSGAALVAIVAPGLTELFGALGSWFAILGFVVLASLYWDRTTDTAAFVGLLVGFLASTGFVVLTGNFQAATMVGLLPTALVVGAVSVLSGD